MTDARVPLDKQLLMYRQLIQNLQMARWRIVETLMRFLRKLLLHSSENMLGPENIGMTVMYQRMHHADTVLRQGKSLVVVCCGVRTDGVTPLETRARFAAPWPHLSTTTIPFSMYA